MDLQKYWRILLANRLMLLALAIAASLAALGLTYLLPAKYQSTAVLLVRPQEKIQFGRDGVGKEILDYPVSQLAPIDAPSKTYIAVIQSRAVIEKIVVALGLHTKTRAPDPNEWKELALKFKDRTADALEWLENIAKYGHSDQESALSKAVSKTARNLSLKPTKDTYVFEIRHEASDPQEAAAVANMAAEIFTQYMSTADNKDHAGSREFLGGRLRESERELETSRQALRKYKEGHATFLLDDEYKSRLKMVSDLEAELEKTNARLAGLTKDYSESYPKVVALVAEREQTVRALAESRSGLGAHPAKQNQVDRLALQLKVAEDNYALVSKAYEDARLAEMNRSSEIRIVSRAEPADFPSKPIKYYYAGGGFAVALFLGIAWATFRETQRARIRSIADVTAALGLPVLATIPVIRFLSRAGRA